MGSQGHRLNNQPGDQNMNIRNTLLALALSAGTLSSAHAIPITTLFAANNEGDGNMFDVETFGNSVLIQSLEINTFGSAGTQTIYLYTRSGTYDGFQNIAAGWTLRDTVVVTNAPGDTPVLFDVADFGLAAGATTGFFVVGDISNASLAYTNGSGVFTDANLQIRSGLNGGLAFGGGNHFGNTVFSPRIWNGTINYSVVPEPTTMALIGIGLAGFAFRRKTA